MEKQHSLTTKRIMGITLLVLLLIAFPFLVWVSPSIAEFNPVLGVIYFVIVMIGMAMYICLVIDRVVLLFKKGKKTPTDSNKNS